MSDRRLRVLLPVLAIAFVVSVFHYTDNYVNFADYAAPDEDSWIPWPGKPLVILGWIGFTASGVAGLVLYLKGRLLPAAFGLAGYSVSGLIGVGHYLAPDATDMVWWRQGHIALDFTSGVLVAACAIWIARDGAVSPARVAAE